MHKVKKQSLSTVKMVIPTQCNNGVPVYQIGANNSAGKST